MYSSILWRIKHGNNTISHEDINNGIKTEASKSFKPEHGKKNKNNNNNNKKKEWKKRSEFLSDGYN